MTTEQIREIVRTVVVVGIIMIGGCIWDQAHARPIEYNPADSPIPAAEMVPAIEYALWSLTSRTDLEAEYVGLTGNQKTMGRITVQWGNLPQPKWWGELYGWTEWHFYDENGPDVMVRVILDINLAGTKVDACLRETLVHEIIHAFQGHIRGDPRREDGGHSTDRRDLMYGDRGECRYSPSLNDLAMLELPVTSCHVELTPDGNLESLSYIGKRYTLSPSGANQWRLGSVYANPLPKDCSGVTVESGVITAHVRSFGGGSDVWRLRNTNGNFVRF